MMGVGVGAKLCRCGFSPQLQPIVESLCADASVLHCLSDCAVGFGRMAAISESASVGEFEDVAEGVVDRRGVGPDAHFSEPWRVDDSASTWKRMEPAGGRGVTALVIAVAYVTCRRDLLTSERVEQCGLACTRLSDEGDGPVGQRRAELVDPGSGERRHASHVDAWCAGGREVFDIGGVVEEIALGQDHQRCRAGIPCHGDEAVDPSRANWAVQPTDDPDDVDVGRDQLLVSGRRVTSLQQRSTLQHFAHDVVLDQDPVADRERRRAGSKVDWAGPTRRADQHGLPVVTKHTSRHCSRPML